MTDPGPATFTQVMTEHEDLTRRLSDLGTQPVPDAARAEHLHAMRAAEVVDAGPRQKRFGRVAVAAAAIVGFLAGSTGLAVAGALPDPAQGVAHDVLSVVQVDVPDRPDNRGACISAAAKQTDPAAKQAAKDLCPKGGPPDGVPGKGPDAAPGRDKAATRGANADDDPCTGRPPWAGQRLTPEERETAKAAFAAQCPGRAADDEVEDEDEDDEVEDEDEDDAIETERLETEAAETEPIDDAPIQDEPAADESVEDVPAEDEPVADEPIEEAPVEEAPVDDLGS